MAAGRKRAGRLGVDIGGTFTDVALEVSDSIGGQRFSVKVLTTPEAPERAVIAAIREVLLEAALAPRDLSLIIHGTTLATNAVTTTIQGSQTSTTALRNSTEDDQFFDKPKADLQVANG